MQTEQGAALDSLNVAYNGLYTEKRKAVDRLLSAVQSDDAGRVEEAKAEVRAWEEKEKVVRDSVKHTIKKAVPNAKENDTDYIFLNFVLSNLPHGIIGLLLAVMFSAAMSSMAGELNALASTSIVDIYKRGFVRNASPEHYVKASQWMTFGWAVAAMIFAMLARFSENLIQYVNIVGSLFYGTLLGIFLTAFYIPFVRGTAVFWAAIISESIVLYCYGFTDIAFLLYNLIGCGIVIVVALLLQLVMGRETNEK